MPSLRTRLAYSNLALAGAQEALSQASQAVNQATEQLEQIADGTLELEAILVNGDRYVSDGTQLILDTP